MCAGKICFEKSSRIVLCQEIICAFFFLKLAADHEVWCEVKLRVCNQGWQYSHICVVVSKRRWGDMRGSVILRAF